MEKHFAIWKYLKIKIINFNEQNTQTKISYHNTQNMVIKTLWINKN